MNAARWSGADPRRVAVLMDGLERAHRGAMQMKLERERSGMLGFGVVRVLLLLGSIFVSLIITGIMIAVPAQAGPGLATAVVVFSGFGAFVVAMLLSLPFLLGDDDAPVLGHWPVTARDVGTARLMALLREVLQIGVPSAGILSLAPAIRAQPYVLQGVIAWGASVAQTVMVTMLVAWFVIVLRRVLGPRRAQRLAAATGIVFLQTCALGAMWLARQEWVDRAFEAITWQIWLFPPVWFTAWPSLIERPVPVALAVALATLVGLVVFSAMVIRTMARAGGAEAGEARRSGRRQGRSWLDLWFRPWLPGPACVVPRRLLMAHAREDWHFVMRAASVPLLVLAMLLMERDEGGPAGLVAAGDGFRMAHVMLIWIAMGAATVLVATTTSRLREAVWIVAVGPAADAPWDAWQRGMVRAMLLPVAAAVWITLHAIAGSAPWLVLDDLVVLVSMHEAVLRWTQIVQWRAPFTLDPSFVDGRIVGAVTLALFTVLPATGAWLALVHARFPWGPPLTYALLTALIVGAARHARNKPRLVLRTAE